MEIWRDIQGYEGYYQVSNQGRVKAVERSVTYSNGRVHTHPEKILKPDVFAPKNSNYFRVTLSKGCKTKRFNVHQLVAKAFLPNPENKPHVNHLDNNGENNFVENLEWCTHSENMKHAQKQGRLFEAQSAGGKLGGLVSKKIRLDSIDQLQGKHIGRWYVENVPHLVKNKKAYVSCKCVCGTEDWVEVTRLVRRETLNCRACGQRERKKMKI